MTMPTLLFGATSLKQQRKCYNKKKGEIMGSLWLKRELENLNQKVQADGDMAHFEEFAALVNRALKKDKNEDEDEDTDKKNSLYITNMKSNIAMIKCFSKKVFQSKTYLLYIESVLL